MDILDRQDDLGEWNTQSTAHKYSEPQTLILRASHCSIIRYPADSTKGSVHLHPVKIGPGSVMGWPHTSKKKVKVFKQKAVMSVWAVVGKAHGRI